MEPENNVQPQQKPFYKRPRVYLVSALSVAAGIILLIILTVFALRWVNPSVTSFTYQENWDELETERYSLTDYWVPADDIPEHMKWAVIASEDQLFYEHWGFDLESIQEAWDERQQGERVRGASTISQQVAKNLFLSPAQSFFRKGIEAGFTVLIELFWPKERIMEVYLNIAEFGPGVFGIGKAAEVFYDLPAASLDPEMSTRLAAVLPSPKRMRVNPPSPYAEERSGWILRQMTQLSGIAYYQPPAPEPDELGTLHEPISDSLSTPESNWNEEEFHISRLDSLIFALEEPEPFADVDSLQPPASAASDTLQIEQQEY
ncbi:monofunctional biosynthetic peptidoglycan transglycosylase [Rhodohalobacter sp. SW132]|uniref:monofunctional biosynthetic peptidoglycan transglycosylase n=1 Tax=Rhodohalobacter sp. SW132 TaxID=2293433 RepID=UPI000E226CD6|nr:monofunctional biosynthetic peptidoglycan transglycosylase [Rhodohalobacter sp. SW132]REL39090.1 monofunctional biosynthetic peptidoglycan transglycosylase [Rhodohalobacter sp. SW132]